MSYGEIWPDHHDAALDRVADDLWRDLERMGGRFVRNFRNAMHVAYCKASHAEKAGDREAASAAWLEFEEAAQGLESFLAYVGEQSCR